MLYVKKRKTVESPGSTGRAKFVLSRWLHSSMGTVKSTPKPAAMPAAGVAPSRRSCWDRRRRALAKAQFDVVPSGRQAQDARRVRHVPLRVAQSLNAVDPDQRVVVIVLGHCKRAVASPVVREEHLAGVDVGHIIGPGLDVLTAGCLSHDRLEPGTSNAPTCPGLGSVVLNRAGEASFEQARVVRLYAYREIGRQYDLGISGRTKSGESDRRGDRRRALLKKLHLDIANSPG